ncbi:MAG: hypothetical protein GY953_33080 [bacterium]|nr:hypothetical protein [bacterium]
MSPGSLTAALALLAACPLLAADTIQAFGHTWHVPIGADWKVERSDGAETLHLLVPRPSRQPRRPTQFALAETRGFSKVTVEAEVRKEPAAARNRHTSLMIVYAYQDEAHFNYAHLSVDTGEQVAVHNGVFHVYGGDRVRISSTKGPPALTGEQWHKVRLEWDGATGRVDVFVDGKPLPSLTAYDLSLTHGKVGLGSFFDMGSFRRVKITGAPAE